MPVLKNPRHERFAQLLASGKTADAAYQEAGYKPNRGNAGDLKAKQYIQDRLAELQERAVIKTIITVETLTAMLVDDRRQAKGLEQIGPAVNAAMAIGKLHGLFIDRKEVGAPGEFTNMTLEQKRARADAIVQELGLDAQDAIGPAAGSA